MLRHTHMHYAQNYAGIIRTGLILVRPLLQLLTTTTISWYKTKKDRCYGPESLRA